MGADPRLTAVVAGNGTPQVLGGKTRTYDAFRANNGTGDVRGEGSKTIQIITLQSFGGTDSFKVRVYTFPNTGTSRLGGPLATDTVAFVRGTNATAAAIQTALRTATGDTTLTVTGNTDAGPFTVTGVGEVNGVQPLFALVTLSGCSGTVARDALAYDDPVVTLTGTSPGARSDNGIHFDQEASLGYTVDVPLGQSIKTDGIGQTAGAELLPPTQVSAVGGVGQVVIDNTEAASAGTTAAVLYAIVDIATGKTASSGVVDADADLTTSSLAAGNYYLLGHSLTYKADTTTVSRISRPGLPQYFTVT